MTHKPGEASVKHKTCLGLNIYLRKQLLKP